MFDHVTIRVYDLAAAQRFYETVLGPADLDEFWRVATEAGYQPRTVTTIASWPTSLVPSEGGGGTAGSGWRLSLPTVVWSFASAGEVVVARLTLELGPAGTLV